MMNNKDQIEQLRFSQLRDLIRKSGDYNIIENEGWLFEIVQFHKNNAIRRSAVVALGKLCSKKAYPLLIWILATEFSNQNLRESAIKALGKIGNTETTEILNHLAKSEEISKFGRQAAQNALAKLYLTLASSNKIKTHTAFISYSSKDQEFAERLYKDLQKKDIRCWFSSNDLEIGIIFRQQINDSIHAHDKLLVILSESSISSPWVQYEVETAIERERRENRLILFPIRIDDAILHTTRAWASSVRIQRHIGNFKAWKDYEAYQNSLARLMRDLKIK